MVRTAKPFGLGARLVSTCLSQLSLYLCGACSTEYLTRERYSAPPRAGQW